MKLTTRFLLIILISAVSFSQTEAQSKKDDREFDREPSRIGVGVNIGNIRFYNNLFEFGLAPNVAYRFGESFAVGFMLKADYFNKRYRFQGVKFSTVDLGPTFFGRVKPLWSWDAATPFLKGIFLQAEYERAFARRPYETSFGEAVLDANGKVQRAKLQENFLYLGAGLSSGYPFSTFVSIHYNALDDFDSLRDPFIYRIGFTYNY